MVPFTREFLKRNDQVEALQSLPFYNTSPAIEDVPQSTPQKKQFLYVDLDGELLNQTHRENLQDLELDLPSEVQRKGTYQETLNIIKTENRKIGQHLGILQRKMRKKKQCMNLKSKH